MSRCKRKRTAPFLVWLMLIFSTTASVSAQETSRAPKRLLLVHDYRQETARRAIASLAFMQRNRDDLFTGVPEFWEQYKGRILIALGIMIVQTILISGLLIERNQKKRAMLKLAESITERTESEERLAELTGRLLRTQDDERRRIARELHDVTAQSIGLIMLNLSQVQKAASTLDERTKDKLTESLTFCEQALKDIRTLSYVLHPPLLDQAGLITALKWYVKGFSDRSGVTVTFNEEGNDGHRMPPDVEYALFRIVQESLTNLRRHTNSETAVITLKRTPNEVLMSIRDRGQGAKLDLPRNGDGVEGIGVGIPGMQHRLKQLGGDLLVDSDSGGTTVTAMVPVRWVVYDSNPLS